MMTLPFHCRTAWRLIFWIRSFNRWIKSPGLCLDRLAAMSSTVYTLFSHDDVIKWNNFPRYWPFVRGIHRSPVNSPHKGQWRGALTFSLICPWTNGWVKKSRRWWSETPLRSLWRHCNATHDTLQFLSCLVHLAYNVLFCLAGTDVVFSPSWPSDLPSVSMRPNPPRRSASQRASSTVSSPPAEQQTPRARSAEVTVADMVSRLSRPNTSTGRRAVLWSKPRREYEGDHNFHATIKEPTRYWTHFPGLPRHYPGTWATISTVQLQGLVDRLSRPTTASSARAEEIITRRKIVTEFFAHERSKDMVVRLASRSRAGSAVTPRATSAVTPRASSAVTPRRTLLPPATPTSTYW